MLLFLIRVGIHHMMFNHCFGFTVLAKPKMFLFIDLLVLEQWKRKFTKDKSIKVHLDFELLMNSKWIGMYTPRDVENTSGFLHNLWTINDSVFFRKNLKIFSGIILLNN